MRFQMLTIAVVFGGLVFADDSRDEATAAKKIELLGAKVVWDETLPGSPVVAIDFQGNHRISDGFLHRCQRTPRNSAECEYRPMRVAVRFDRDTPL